MVYVEISIASFFELPEPILMILGAKWPHSRVLLEKLKNSLIFESRGPLFCENDEKWTKLWTKTTRGSDFHRKIIRENDKIRIITFGKIFSFYQSRFVPIFSLIAPISWWHAPNPSQTRWWTRLPDSSLLKCVQISDFVCQILKIECKSRILFVPWRNP